MSILAGRKAFIGAGILAGKGVLVPGDVGFAFATADGSKILDIQLRFPIGKSITVSWGNGDSDTYNGNDNTNVQLTKDYGEAGTFPITFKGDYLDLTHVICNTQSLSGDISGWSALTLLESINTRDNNLTGDVSGFRAMLLTAIFNIQGNNFNFNSSAAWTGKNISTFLTNCSLTSQEVDDALIAFAGGLYANKTIALGGNNGPRTAASDAAVATLEGNGNTVITS